VSLSDGSEISVKLRESVADGHRIEVVRQDVRGAAGLALVFHYMIDNFHRSAPPTAKDIETLWAGLRAEFPNAKIQASSLDEYAKDLIQRADMSSLPIIKGEIGDSW
jgi:hypothetical protein